MSKIVDPLLFLLSMLLVSVIFYKTGYSVAMKDIANGVPKYTYEVVVTNTLVRHTR